MDNWNKLSTPPKEALKTIQAGRLKGKSDINPQWRIKAMTEVYGTCGIGWKWEIVNKWTEQGDNDQVMCFADVNVYIRHKDEVTWSDPIPGTGGSMLITKEKNGLHSSDEGYKMAVTDALSVALKFLGVASDVYEGKMNGVEINESKYQKKQFTNDENKTWYNKDTNKKAVPQFDIWKQEGKDGKFAVAQVRLKYKVSKAWAEKIERYIDFNEDTFDEIDKKAYS